MISGTQLVALLEQEGISHVIWLPDSTTGPWEQPLDASPRLSLLRIAREGEAWALAGGLYLGGKQPLVIMQSTGFFEAGDSMRNMLFDWELPLYAIVGIRSYHVANSTDSAKHFIEPIVRGWGLDYCLIEGAEELPRFAEHYRECQQAKKPGIALLAE